MGSASYMKHVKTMKKLKNWILVIGPSIMAFLSNLPIESTKPFIAKLIQYKLCVSIFITLLILLIQFYELIFSKEERVIKAWTKRFLRFIAKEQLGGGEYHTRISILRPEKGWKFILKYLYFVFVKNFINNFKDRTWGKYIRNIPIHLFSDYLTLYARYSYPNEEKSYTHFKISKKNEGLNGVADKCYKEGREIEVNTCDISHVELPLSFQDIKTSRTMAYRDVKKYMEDAFFDEDNYNSLLNMNTKANNLYALAITNDDEEIWGVLIVDNVGSTARSFKTELESVIEKYAKIFCFTLSTVK